MTTDAVTPLRHRMIEDMNARKLCAGTQAAALAETEQRTDLEVAGDGQQAPRLVRAHH